MREQTLTSDVVLRAYASGIFPMAESRDNNEIFWVDPVARGILPLDRFHISRSLARRLRKADHKVTANTAFEAVLDACAARDETWINDTIRQIYLDLHAEGHAHSLEIWREADLFGGVYGVAFGAAFFGESMFSRATDGSKMALAYLVDRLRRSGFQLFDTQFVTPHLESLGAIEIPRADYRERLMRALPAQADFTALRTVPTPEALIQANASAFRT